MLGHRRGASPGVLLQDAEERAGPRLLRSQACDGGQWGGRHRDPSHLRQALQGQQRCREKKGMAMFLVPSFFFFISFFPFFSAFLVFLHLSVSHTFALFSLFLLFLFIKNFLLFPFFLFAVFRDPRDFIFSLQRSARLVLWCNSPLYFCLFSLLTWWTRSERLVAMLRSFPGEGAWIMITRPIPLSRPV